MMKGLSYHKMIRQPRKVFIRTFTQAALAILLQLRTPFFERDAHAQPASPSTRQTTSETNYTVSGARNITLRQNGNVIRTLLVFENVNSVPSISFNGPSTVQLRFYPLIDSRELRQTSSLDYVIRYLVDGIQSEQPGTSSRSRIRADQINLAGQVIGTPWEITVRVEVEGQRQHTLRVIETGFLEILNVIPIPVQQLPEAPIQPQQPLTTPRQPPPPIRPPIVRPPLQQIPDLRRFELVSSSVWFRDIGVNNTAGFSGFLSGKYWYPLSRRFSTGLGLDLGIYNARVRGQSIQPDLSRQGIDIGRLPIGDNIVIDSLVLSQSVIAEVERQLGRNLDGRVYAAVLLGAAQTVIDAMVADHEFFVNGRQTTLISTRNRSESQMLLEMFIGGRVGFDYAERLGVYVQLSNHPTNPGRARIYVRIPSWVRGSSLEINTIGLWLRNVRIDSGGRGRHSFSDDYLLLQLAAEVPIFRLGPVVPEVFVGARHNRTFGENSTENYDILLGSGILLRDRRFSTRAWFAVSLVDLLEQTGVPIPTAGLEFLLR